MAFVRPAIGLLGIIARSNYWSGASDSDVANLIYDRSVDPMFEMDVPYLPTLSAPDPATPAP